MSHVDEGELTAYADGAYAPADLEGTRIAQHLEVCENCRNRWAQAVELRQRAGEILALATPRELAVPPFQNIQQQATSTSRVRRTTLPLAWAATIVLALGIGWFGSGLMREQQRLTSLDRATTPAASPESSPAADESQALRLQEAPPPSQTAANESETRGRAAPTTRRQAAPVAPSEDANDAAEKPALADRSPAIAGVAATGQSAQALRERDSAVVPAAAPPPPPAPQPVAALARMEAAAARDMAMIEYITPAQAEQRGLRTPLIPELEVMRIGVAGTHTVVEQRLSDGVLVTLEIPAPQQVEKQVSARAVPQSDAAAAARDQVRGRVMNVVTVVRDGTTIRVQAPVSMDSLRVLAGKVRLPHN